MNKRRASYKHHRVEQYKTDTIAGVDTLTTDKLVASPLSHDTTDFSTVTNADFLIGVFGAEGSYELPIICAFSGNPRNTAAKNWTGQPWIVGETNTDQSDSNGYFSLATYQPTDNGQYRRAKKYFTGLSAIMLDDVGTKAGSLEDLVNLPPSWLIETSQGNYQAGYLLAEPLTDPVVAEALYKAIIKKGLCDPGAGGPLTRYARLPVGNNGKHTPPFQCRLTDWHSDRRYTVQEIIDGLKLDLDLTKIKRKDASSGKTLDPHDDAVYTPRTAENKVLTALKAAGLYKSPLGDGKHDITCPWCQEHTDQVDGGTAYWEPDDNFQTGGFHCFHGHCADRHVRDLLQFLGVAAQEACHKPTIRIVPGQMGRIVSAAEHELAQTGRHYQRGGLIVTVLTDPGTQQTGIKELNPQNLVLRISAIAIWERFNKDTSCWEVCDPPVRHSVILYHTNVYPSLPVLLGLARQPYLRPDGSLVTEPGYDGLTKLFGVFDASEFSVPEHPTRSDAMAALEELMALLGEFSFDKPCDLAAALAGILTATIRPSLPLAPMFHVRAPQIASGKSYLCILIAAFGSPTIPSAVSFPTDDEECRKFLLAALLIGPSAIIFDNLTSDLIPYKSLCSALTEEYITGRILGVSKTATVGTRAMFMSSGNNVDPVRDMARRCITIRLDPACEVPAARKFRSDPVGTVRHDRAKYVSLALTIIRAWIVAGRPKTSISPLASYEQWSDLVRQPLHWLGLPDPATALFETMAADPDRETLGRLMALWSKFFGVKATMVRDLVKAIEKGSKDPERLELQDILLDIADARGEVDRRRLGWWIKKHANRPVDGFKIERAPGQRNADQWVVVSVVSVSSDVFPPSTTDASSTENAPASDADVVSASMGNALIHPYDPKEPTEPTEPTLRCSIDKSEEAQS
jgi:hypothetical protein